MNLLKTAVNVVTDVVKSALGIGSVSDIFTNAIKDILGQKDVPISQKIEQVKNETIKLVKTEQITEDKTMIAIQNVKGVIQQAFYKSETDMYKAMMNADTEQHKTTTKLYTDLARMSAGLGIKFIFYTRSGGFWWAWISSFAVLILYSYLNLNDGLTHLYISGCFAYIALYGGAKTWEQLKDKSITIKDIKK